MTEREALKLALKALKQIDAAMPFPVAKLAIKKAEEALAQPEQEPVACPKCKEWEAVCDQHLRHIKKIKKQRTWVGLTDEEKSDIWCVVTNRDFVTEDTHVYADALEAKLKEKNT